MDPTVIVAIIGSCTTIGSIILTNYLNKKKQNSNRHPDGRVKLSYHDLFRRMDYWISYLNTSFHLSDTGKEAVMREMLVNKFQIWKEELYELSKEVQTCLNTCDKDACSKLVVMNIKAFTKAHERTMVFCNDPNRYSDDERKALSLVAAKFDRWHSRRIEYISSEIENKGNSAMHSDCYVRQVAIFDSYVGAFADTIFDAETTLNDINGDLNGLVFNGLVIDSHR